MAELNRSAVEALQAAAMRMLDDERERLNAVLSESPPQLMELGGDPLTKDWARFRPLRLGREEDW